MEALAMAAIAAVQKAGVADEITRRVFERPPADLLERLDPDDEASELCYRPMVELLLHEIVAVGSDKALNTFEQQRRIVWALDMAGF